MPAAQDMGPLGSPSSAGSPASNQACFLSLSGSEFLQSGLHSCQQGVKFPVGLQKSHSPGDFHIPPPLETVIEVAVAESLCQG